MAEHPIKRCAVYTRKSSEEGLEQDYNSLHAQRDACEAYIKSQGGEGWRLNKAAYDDGGFPAAPWKDQRCSNFSQPFAKDSSTWWWSTKSTDSRVHWLTSRA